LPVRGEAGLVANPDLSFADVMAKVGDYGVLVLPGMDRVDPVLSMDSLYELVQRCAKAGLVIGGISAGTYVMARAGILEGRRYTQPWPDEEKRLLGVFPAEGQEASRVVVDGPVITAHGRAHLAFGLALGRRLGFEFSSVQFTD
jgi:4-methyl-5(b-hydroxyethyl)-thiazole monophosphate biosynthesis